MSVGILYLRPQKILIISLFLIKKHINKRDYYKYKYLYVFDHFFLTKQVP